MRTLGYADIVRSLTDEWERDLGSRTKSFGRLGTWTGNELISHIRSLAKAERNSTVLELVARAKHGDTSAERVVLQMMIPRAFALARRRAHVQNMTLDASFNAAVSALWEAIRTYPLHCSRNVIGTIACNTLMLLTRDFGKYAGPDITIVSSDVVAEEAPTSPESPSSSAFAEVMDLLAWALDSGALSRSEVQILARTDLGDKHDRDELAAELGIRRDSLNRRAYRIREKLKQAVHDFILENGHW